MVKRINVSPTPQFHEALRQYQQANNLRSLSEALLQLAAAGLYIRTGQRPPEYSRSWGGEWRDGIERELSEIELDRLNALLGRADILTDSEEE